MRGAAVRKFSHLSRCGIYTQRYDLKRIFIVYIVGMCYRIEKYNKFTFHSKSEVKHPTLSIHPFNVNYAERRHILPSKSMKTKTLKILKYVIIINNHDSIFSCVTYIFLSYSVHVMKFD